MNKDHEDLTEEEWRQIRELYAKWWLERRTVRGSGCKPNLVGFRPVTTSAESADGCVMRGPKP